MRRPLLVLLALVPLASCAPAPTPEAAAPTAGAGDVAFYTCPMHPSIQQPGPGSCPICGMPLTPVTRAEQASGAVRVDAGRRARFGIELEAAAVRPMAATLEVPAVVGWAADGLTDVTVRASGWARQVVAAPGEPVRAGQVLFRLFSPEVVTAQDDLLRATAQVAAGDPSAGERRDAARRRLGRLGVADADVAAIVAGGRTVEEVPIRAPRGGVVLERAVVDGAMVGAGQALYRLGDPSAVWVEGAVPEDHLGALAPGQAVSVAAAGLDHPLDGTVERVLPTIDPTTRTARVRVRVANPDGRLRPDQWATLTIRVGGGERLAVPETAVLYTGPRRLVFVESDGDRLTPREVVPGLRADGYVEIRDGLTAGERVVRSGSFLVAADSRLQQGGEAGHRHGAAEDATGAPPALPPASPDPHAGHAPDEGDR